MSATWRSPHQGCGLLAVPSDLGRATAAARALELAEEMALVAAVRLQELVPRRSWACMRLERRKCGSGAYQRQILDRPDEGMPFEEPLLLPEQPVELGAVVGRAEPAPEHEVLRPRDRLDRVDLEEAEPPDGVEHTRRRAVEQLRANRDPARLLDGRPSSHHLLEPDRASEPGERAVECVVERARAADAGLDGGTPSRRARPRFARTSGRRGRRCGRRSRKRQDVVAVLPLVLAACRPRSGGRSRGSGARTAGPRAGCRTGRGAPPPGEPAGRAPLRPRRAPAAPPSSTSKPPQQALRDERVDRRPDRRRRRLGGASARRCPPR